MDQTLFLPFFDESECDTNKVIINHFSFSNYISTSIKFLKKIRKLDNLTEDQSSGTARLKEVSNAIIAHLESLENQSPKS